jgi:ABC-type lipoprotein export system ATPase subunit/GNAT superfamily N-acetyltransferase
MKINLKNSIKNDRYTEYVYDTFDIQNRDETETEVSFNLGEAKNFDWNIGVIYGSSGSGKTTILKQMGQLASSNFDGEKSLISNFDWLEPSEASHLLSSMGLSSVPTWLRPFHLLSNGEQFRAELAYKVGKAKDNEVILIDEFTSVVDRDVAKSMSFAIQKYLRKHNKRMIVASCHYDIMEWLTPDWVSSPQKNGGALERSSLLRGSRPNIELQVSRVESSTWDLFKEHHYLTHKANKSCKFLLFTWNNKPVAIMAVINQPRKGCPNGFSLSRLVVLPDYQGLGIGVKLCEFSSAIFKDIGGKIFTKTIHPAVGEHFNRSDNWRGTLKNGKIGNTNDKNAVNRFSRVSYCHEFVGEPIEGYSELLKPIKEMRDLKKNTLKLDL